MPCIKKDRPMQKVTNGNGGNGSGGGCSCPDKTGGVKYEWLAWDTFKQYIPLLTIIISLVAILRS